MSNELATQQQAGLPAYLQNRDGAPRGASGIGQDDVRPPRLNLCQSMTPQRKRQDPKYIAGLEEGDLFNDITEQVYGAGPIQFTVVKYLGKRGIEFAPADEGGGVVDFNVPLNDERMEFRDEIKDGHKTGKRLKPVATLFYDYLVLLIHEDGRHEIAALSMKGTQIKVAVKLNSVIKLAEMAGQDSFAALYTIASVGQTKDSYSFFNFKIERVKVDGKPAFVSEETYRAAEAAYKAFEGKNIIIEREPETREPGQDEDIPY